MHQLLLPSNPNGKLFLDMFSIIEPADNTIFYPGAKFEVYYKTIFFGRAEIVAIDSMEYKAIPEATAYLVSGQSRGSLRKMLVQKHGTDGTLPTTTEFYHITLQYTYRNTNAQGIELHEWWRERFQQSFKADLQHVIADSDHP